MPPRLIAPKMVTICQSPSGVPSWMRAPPRQPEVAQLAYRSHLPVDKLVQVRSVECTGCMECVAVCPADHALQMALRPWPQSVVDGGMPQIRWQRRVLRPQIVAAVLAVVFFGLVGAAGVTGHWQTGVSREVYMDLVPNADRFGH